MAKKIGQKIEFDPSALYSWEPTDEFTLTGDEFSTLYNTLLQEVNTGSGAPIIQKMRCFNIVQALLKQGVEEGMIKRLPEQEKS